VSAEAVELLHAFVKAVNDTGGVWLEDDGGGKDVCASLRADAGTWQLGAVYMNACNELGLEPQAHVPCESTEWDGQDALDCWNAAKEQGRLRS
jgi:hypothetical protein